MAGFFNKEKSICFKYVAKQSIQLSAYDYDCDHWKLCVDEICTTRWHCVHSFSAKGTLLYLVGKCGMKNITKVCSGLRFTQINRCLSIVFHVKDPQIEI